MKRVLCLLSNMNAGGAETFLMKVYRKLDRNEYQMDFCINVKERCYYEDEIENLGGKVYRIPSRSENLIYHCRQLCTTIKREHYEFVLCVGSNPIGFLDCAIAKFAGARKASFRSSNSNGRNSFSAGMIDSICRFVFMGFIDSKLAPSDLAAVFTFGRKQYKNGNISILHNGLDIKAYSFSPVDRENIRCELNLLDALVVGHVGRFNEQKNHKKLVEIFACIKKMNPRAKLLLVGDGNLRSDIRDFVDELGIQEDVIFTGVRSDIPRLLSSMDVFVFPSYYEGMPNTVIEAQASGLHCYIADTITKEANITGNVCYVSLEKNSEEWARMICESDNARDMSAAQVMTDAGYSIDSVVEEFVKVVF